MLKEAARCRCGPRADVFSTLVSRSLWGLAVVRSVGGWSGGDVRMWLVRRSGCDPVLVPFIWNLAPHKNETPLANPANRHPPYGQFASHKRLSNGVKERAAHSALMLEARTTLPHFSVSSAISLPNSAGVIGMVTPPRSARRALNLGSVRPPLISLLSRSTISLGVFLGAPIPFQPLAS